MQVIVTDGKTVKAYHSTRDCKGIKIQRRRRVDVLVCSEIEQEEAEKRGLVPCQRCHR
jgi:hypothetical protein